MNHCPPTSNGRAAPRALRSRNIFCQNRIGVGETPEKNLPPRVLFISAALRNAVTKAQRCEDLAHLEILGSGVVSLASSMTRRGANP